MDKEKKHAAQKANRYEVSKMFRFHWAVAFQEPGATSPWDAEPVKWHVMRWRSWWKYCVVQNIVLSKLERVGKRDINEHKNWR